MKIVSKISLDMMNCGAILALQFLLREDAAFLFDDREITNVQPRILADVLDMNQNVIDKKVFQKDARFKIYTEKVLIAEVHDFVKAVTILIAAHYVFNVAYSKKLHSTYCFIQKYLLEIHDNSNCPTKVLNLMSKLKIYSSI